MLLRGKIKYPFTKAERYKQRLLIIRSSKKPINIAMLSVQKVPPGKPLGVGWQNMQPHGETRV